MQNEQKNNADVIKSAVLKLDFYQKINITAGGTVLAAMPAAIVMSVNPGFLATFNVQIAVYLVFLTAYCAWFFTAHKVFGRIVCRNSKKYHIIDYISSICTAVCPLFVLLFFFLMGTGAGRGQTGYFLHLSEWILAIASVAVFSICRYLEICFEVYDIKKSHICSQDSRTRQ